MLRRIALAGFGVAALFAIGQLIGGDDTGSFGKIDRVSFTGNDRGEGVPTKPSEETVQDAARRVRALLNSWYQEAFADPRRYGDGSFDDLARRFTGEAALGFVEDRETLTIGSFGPRIARIRVDEQIADVVVFTEDSEILYATAQVTFAATARLKDAEHPVLISQSVDLVLENREGTWLITNYYDARVERESKPEAA